MMKYEDAVRFVMSTTPEVYSDSDGLSNFPLDQVNSQSVIPTNIENLTLVRSTSEEGFALMARHNAKIIRSVILNHYHYLVVEGYE